MPAHSRGDVAVQLAQLQFAHWQSTQWHSPQLQLLQPQAMPAPVAQSQLAHSQPAPLARRAAVSIELVKEVISRSPEGVG